MKLFILFLCISSVVCYDVAEDFFKVLENLKDIDERWIQLISMPEMAMLLQEAPNNYLSSGLLDNITLNDLMIHSDESQTDEIETNGRSCSDDIVQMLYNLGSDWALKMLDSDGKLSSAILRGSLVWPGHFEECNSVVAPRDEKGHGGFRGKYCTTSWTMNFTEKFSNLPMIIGLCFPDSCSEQEIHNYGRNLLNFTKSYPVINKLSSIMSLTNVVCKEADKSLDLPSIIYLVVVSCFMFLTVIGTAVAVIHHKRRRPENLMIISPNSENPDQISNEMNGICPEAAAINSSKKNYETISPGLTSQEEANGDTVSLTQDAEKNTEIVFQKKTVEPVWKRVLMCFSAIDNGEKILNTKTSEGQLSSVHGIRFLSLTWVILGHTYISSVSVIGNRKDVLKIVDSLPFQVLLQAPYSVDSFFLLSGLLLTYLFMKEAHKKNGKINWPYFYLHRLWRLTPVYMVIVFFYIYVFKFMSSGPFWDDHQCDAARGSWWKYLLYINNFIPIHEMCLGWSWYLANDMQFYLISPIFLYPLWRWPLIGFTVLFSLLIGTWSTTAVLSYVYDVIPMFVGLKNTKDLAAYQKKMWDSYDLIYDKPYCRIAPYLIGAFLGYLLYKLSKQKNFLNWWQQVLGWTIGLFCGLSVIFGLYELDEIGKNPAMFYNALSRTSFSIGLAWLIFACETGHGSFIAKFLSWKAFIPLSRLTYCAYLIHPILIHGFYQSYQTELFFTQLVMVTNGMGFIFISYGLAFLLSITFESPLMNLEKLLLMRKRQ